jgi:hypothetical protein
MRKSRTRSSQSARKAKRRGAAAVSKSLGLKNRSPKTRARMRKKKAVSELNAKKANQARRKLAQAKAALILEQSSN